MIPTVSPTVISTVPTQPAIGENIDSSATSGLLAAASTLAASSQARQYVNSAGIVETNGQRTVTIGIMALTPHQLEDAGVIKPGSAALIIELINNGKTLEQAFAANVWTGYPGAENLEAIRGNTSVQSSIMTAALEKSKNNLVDAGVITPKDSGSNSGGLILAAATVGVAATLKYLNSSSSNLSKSLSNITSPSVSTDANNSPLGGPAALISAGTQAVATASGLAAKIGGIGDSIVTGIKDKLSSLSSVGDNIKKSIESLVTKAKDASKAAYTAIVSAFPSLKPGVPIDGKKVTEQAIATAQGIVPNTEEQTNQTNPIGSLVEKAKSAVESVVDKIRNPGAALEQVVTNVKKVATATVDGIKIGISNIGAAIGNTVTKINSSVSSGIALLKGGMGSTAATNTSVSEIPGALTNLSELKNTIDGTAKATSASVTSALVGMPKEAKAQLEGVIGSLKNSSPFSISLPKLATATNDIVDRAKKSFSKLVGDGVPLPSGFSIPKSIKFGGLSEQDNAKYVNLNNQIAELEDKQFDLQKNLRDARAEYAAYQANSNADLGEIVSAKEKYETAEAAYNNIIKKIQDLRSQIYKITT